MFEVVAMILVWAQFKPARLCGSGLGLPVRTRSIAGVQCCGVLMRLQTRSPLHGEVD